MEGRVDGWTNGQTDGAIGRLDEWAWGVGVGSD